MVAGLSLMLAPRRLPQLRVSQPVRRRGAEERCTGSLWVNRAGVFDKEPTWYSPSRKTQKLSTVSSESNVEPYCVYPTGCRQGLIVATSPLHSLTRLPLHSKHRTSWRVKSDSQQLAYG